METFQLAQHSEDRETTVCIVDDNPELRNVLATVCKGMGFRTVECHFDSIKDKLDLEVANVLKNHHDPLVMFLDIQMDVMDGFETIELLKDASQDMRIRFMTGGPSTNAVAAQMIAQARDLEVGNSLFKPFSLKDFQKIVLEESESLTRSN